MPARRQRCPTPRQHSWVQRLPRRRLCRPSSAHTACSWRRRRVSQRQVRWLQGPIPPLFCFITICIAGHESDHQRTPRVPASLWSVCTITLHGSHLSMRGHTHVQIRDVQLKSIAFTQYAGARCASGRRGRARARVMQPGCEGGVVRRARPPSPHARRPGGACPVQSGLASHAYTKLAHSPLQHLPSFTKCVLCMIPCFEVML